ncbi:MAG: hypothetical protein ACSHXF_04755 [Aquaticitalea sp.]
MSVKNVLSAVFVLAFVLVSSAQDVKLKKDYVYVDGEQKFQYDKRSGGNEMSLYTLDKEKEIVYIVFNSNGTIQNLEDNFVEITFIDVDMKIETQKFKGRSMSYLLERLFEEKVIDMEGHINQEKLDVFFRKYDEQITERTIRD